MDRETRRFLSIVLVAMLLLTGLLSALVLLPSPEGDGGDRDPGWRVEDDEILVYSDATWRGWDSVLELPVRIEWGCSLTVEDSRLEIPLEELVYEDQEQFYIDDNASLVLRNSTIEVDGDPQLATAVVDWSYRNGPTPMIWRVMNLVDAEEPLLELEVEHINGTSRVVVAYQRLPRDPMEVLTVIGPEDMSTYEWIPFRISLEELAGGTPRIVVFVQGADRGEVMIANVTVSDGGSDLPGDVFGLGDLRDDGWYTDNLDSFTQMVANGNWYINPLIVGRGDLRVFDSEIMTLPGLERNLERYKPQAWAHQDPGGHTAVVSTPFEAGINVSGNLEIVSSTIEYAPIRSEGLRADLRDSTFVGDCQIASFRRTETYMRDCDFEFRSEPGLWENYGLLDDTWMLSIETSVRDPYVKGCTFTGEGSGVGMVVNRQRTDVVDCSFHDLEVGLWVHGADPSMRWASLASSVTFDEDCGVGFMETTEVRVEFDGVERPGTSRYIRWTTETLEEVPGLTEFRFAELLTDHYSLFCLPLVVVGPGFGEVQLTHLDLWVRPPWVDESEMLVVDPSQDYYWLLFEDPDPGVSAYSMILDIFEAPGEAPGLVSTSLYIYNELGTIGDSYLNVSMDGALVDQVDLNSTGVNWSRSPLQWATYEMAVGPGAHEVNLTVGYHFPQWNLTMETGATVRQLFRATGGDDGEELAIWLEDASEATVLVDPDVSVYGIEATLDLGEDFTVSLLTWEGSSMSFDGLDFGQDSWGTLNCEGSGSYSFQSLSGQYLWHNAGNCTVEVGSVDIVWYMPVLFNGELTFLGDPIRGISFDLVNGSRLHLEGIDFVTGWSIEVYASDSEFSMVDCTFTSDTDNSVYISSTDGATINLESCEFMNGGLHAIFNDRNDTWNIRNCTFEGEGSFLRLFAFSEYWGDPGMGEERIPESGSISGNELRGEGAVMIFDPLLRDTILGENAFADGARAYTFYDPRLESDPWGPGDVGFITMDSVAYHMVSPGGWSSSRYFDHMVDVTDDPLGASDPGMVPVVLRVSYSDYSGPRGPVVGFQEIPIAAQSVTLRDTQWGEARWYVEELEGLLDDDEDNWWTE
jgi:hypothetical protein